MSIQQRDYLRGLALHCLQHSGEARTAGDLAEYMGVSAQHEGHPRSAWQHISAQSVAGVMRSLEKQGQVERGAGQHNGTRGREEPTWRAVPGPRRPMPPPPTATDDQPAVATPIPYTHQLREYEGMDRKQLLAVLWAHDEMLVAAARLIEGLTEAGARARQILRQAGLDA